MIVAPVTYRVLDADGELITGGVTERNVPLLDVSAAMRRLKENPETDRERTPDGWTVERE
jgi:hypothetical protein